MKHVFSALLALAAISAAAQAQSPARADVEGTWSARVRVSEKSDGSRAPQLQLQMNVDNEEGRNWSNWGQSVALDAFTNLPANLDPPQDVTFELRRDAGTMIFKGRFESGRGVGHLSFTANRDFERAMEQQTRDTFTDRELMHFALLDVSRAFVKELQSLGFATVTLDDARKLRIHGTTIDFIRGIRAAGYPNADLDDILKLRIHGVTSEYVKEMRAAGLGADLEKLLQLRIHGVTPAFARGMASLGYTLGADDLRKFRIHGVSASYVRELGALGYKNIAADSLVKFRIHGVTPSFVKELEASGYKNLSEDELVDWAIHGRRLLKYKRR